MITPATGWNTWNYEHLTALSYVDNDHVAIEVRVSVFDEITLEHVTDIRWRDLVHLGPHAFDGTYMALEFQAGFEARYLLEAAADGRRLALRVTPTRPSAKRVVMETLRPGASLECRRAGDTWHLEGWRVRVDGAAPPHTFYVRTTGPSAVGRRGDALAAIVVPEGEDASGDPERIVEEARRRHGMLTTASDGALGDSVQVMLRAAAWNTVYDLTGRGVCTTASRDWCKDWRSVVLFGWDTYFNGMIAGVESPEHAWANYAASLAGVSQDGFVPNWRLSNDVYTVDRSQPPVGAFCVWQTHLRHPDREQLRRLYPGLKWWHLWWMGARSTPEGLLAWGSNPRAGYAYPELKQAMYGAQICCCYESGMDNSPMFDGVPYDHTTGRMLQADVGLTSLYAADAECLCRIAEALDEDDEALGFAAEAERIRERINALLWCQEEGIYLNRRSDGTFNRRRSPTSFYPLLCGAPSPERAERLVREHLLNPGEFWGDYPLPSISRDDADYRDNDYWRGRIWAPATYLAVEGLRRYGMHETAHEVVRRSLAMFRDNWARRGAVYENYNADTGDGGDVPNADPLYVWGGLLAYLGLQELGNPTDAGITFGSPYLDGAAVRNLPMRGRRYDVRQGADGLAVDRDGQELLRASGPCRVTVGASRLRVQARSAVEVRVGGWEPGQEVACTDGTRDAVVAADAAGWLRWQPR